MVRLIVLLLLALSLGLGGCTSEKTQVQAYLESTGKVSRQIQPLLERWVLASDLMPGQKDRFLQALDAVDKEAADLKKELQAISKPPERAKALNESYIRLLEALEAASQDDRKAADMTTAELQAGLAESQKRVDAIVKEQDESKRLRQELVQFCQ